MLPYRLERGDKTLQLCMPATNLLLEDLPICFSVNSHTVICYSYTVLRCLPTGCGVLSEVRYKEISLMGCDAIHQRFRRT